MAKGQVTADDLASGIKTFGGLSSLGGASRPVRDNPFRDTRAEPVTPSVAAPIPTPTPEPAPEPPHLEVIARSESTEAGEGSKATPVPPQPRVRKPTPTRVANAVAAPTPAVANELEPTGREKKTEVYTERLTVLLNAELRDAAESLAKDLQRRRTRKGERLTTNTVIRVALRVMLENFDPSASVDLNTEGDLFEATRQYWSRK